VIRLPEPGGTGQEEEENKMTVEEYERLDKLLEEAEQAVDRLLDAAQDLEKKEFDYVDEKLDEVLSSLERLGIRWYRLFHPKKKPVKHEELHTDNPGYDA
jgi:ribosome assembly protein YihI (activator of Der GTPase)